MPDLASAPTPLIKASPRNITTVHSVRGWVSMSPANPFLRFLPEPSGSWRCAQTTLAARNGPWQPRFYARRSTTMGVPVVNQVRCSSLIFARVGRPLRQMTHST